MSRPSAFRFAAIAGLYGLVWCGHVALEAPPAFALFLICLAATTLWVGARFGVMFGSMSGRDPGLAAADNARTGFGTQPGPDLVATQEHLRKLEAELHALGDQFRTDRRDFATGSAGAVR